MVLSLATGLGQTPRILIVCHTTPIFSKLGFLQLQWAKMFETVAECETVSYLLCNELQSAIMTLRARTWRLLPKAILYFAHFG